MGVGEVWAVLNCSFGRRPCIRYELGSGRRAKQCQLAVCVGYSGIGQGSACLIDGSGLKERDCLIDVLLAHPVEKVTAFQAILISRGWFAAVAMCGRGRLRFC